MTGEATHIFRHSLLRHAAVFLPALLVALFGMLAWVGVARAQAAYLLPLGTLIAVVLSLALNGALARLSQREEEQNEQLLAANRALQQSERRLQGLLANSHDLLTVADERRHITFASPSVERVLGYTPEEILRGQTMLQLVHPDDVAETIRFRDVTFAQPRTPQSATLRMRTRDGSYRTIHYIGINLLDDPAIQGYVYNGRDITELLHLEEQLLQSQKMEAVGRLAGGIAHDFNNLITTIKGHVTFALEDLGEHAVRADLEEVDAAADRAAGLTRQLLVFSRQQPVDLALVDLREVVRGFNRMIRRVIGEDIELQVSTPPQPLYVRADAGQLNQVLMNLVVNARDALPHGGCITVELAVQAGRARLSVSDNGQGIPAEIREQIFEPFFTTKEKGRGTGLGLATVYGIVKQSRGEITVETELGKGTRFSIFLPAASVDHS